MRDARPWEQVSLVAARQGRAIHVRQLHDCGLSRKAIQTGTAVKHLHHVHRGVRAVGIEPLSPLGRQWAAVLAGGTGAAITGLTAGSVYGLHGWHGAVHIAAPTHRRSHRGVVVHHVAGLTADMIGHRQGLPVLRPAHVLLELAAHLNTDALADALNEALSLPVVRLREVESALERRPGHHGCGALAAAIRAVADDPGAGRTRSELENLVMVKLRALPRLPPYRRNELVQLAGGRVANADILFSGQRLMVELDSRRWHEQRRAMDSDRRRDQQALAVGLTTFRITWRHVIQDWEQVSTDLLATLDGRR